MAAKSPQNRNQSGPSPLPVSALPLPAEDGPQDEAPATALPTPSNGKLTPAQRARLGLDSFGDQPAPQPAGTNGNGSAAASANGADSTSEFDFAGMDPRLAAAPGPEPQLAPVQAAPKLAPVGTGKPNNPAVTPAGQARQAQAEASADAGSRRKEQPLTVSERDGIPQMERDRTVLGYGVAWTFFCLFVAAVVSAASLTADANMGPTPSAFVPAMISIVLGWIVVAIGHKSKAWGWFMIVPAVVLVLGPFVYASWHVGKVESEARALLSSAGAQTTIDIDQSSILSGTVNIPGGCFALFQDRSSGDIRVDVVTYAPATAQQQATLALAPRFARRVSAGGDKVYQRSFNMAGGNPPVNAIEQTAPPIDCEGAGAP